MDMDTYGYMGFGYGYLGTGALLASTAVLPWLIYVYR